MKILKLLSKKKFLLILFFIFFNVSSANEPVDIWNIDKSINNTNEETQNETQVSNDILEKPISIYDLNNKKIKIKLRFFKKMILRVKFLCLDCMIQIKIIYQ